MKKGEFKYGISTRLYSEYRIWAGIKYRCYNKNYPEFYLYGGRGITVCDKWRNNFEAFLLDMGRRPSKKHSIDRIDSNGNYDPSNCRWSTSYEQIKNRRVSRWINFGGKNMILKEWADYLGATPINLLRMMKSKPFDKIVDYYQNRRRKLPCKNERDTHRGL